MTMPFERYYSIAATGRFLRSLMDPKLSPGVPGYIRKAACRRLRHYPENYHIEEMSKREGTPITLEKFYNEPYDLKNDMISERQLRLERREMKRIK